MNISTGSVVGPTIIRFLRSRGFPVMGVVVGDSSNGLSCKNTLNTIATLDAIAKKVVKKPIPIIYYNNHVSEAAGSAAKESEVNHMIYNALSVMSLFLSGENEDIDTRDMINFLSPDNYESIKIDPAVYCINIFTNDEVKNDANVVNLIGRTLMVTGQDSDIGLTLLQHKYGLVTDPNAVNSAREITPVHMVLTGNYLVGEHKRLTTTVAEYEAIANSISSEDLGGSSDAGDDGMVF